MPYVPFPERLLRSTHELTGCGTLRVHRTRTMVIGALISLFVVSNSSPAEAAKSTTTTTKAKTTAKTKVVNVKLEVEGKLETLQRQASPNLVVGKATCPAAMASVQATGKKVASAPVTHRCTVVVEGVAAPYNVEVRDGGFANGGSFLMARAKAIIDISRVVDGTRRQLDAGDQKTAQISCGKAKVQIASVGDTITCSISFADAKAAESVVYEVRDLDGTISIRL